MNNADKLTDTLIHIEHVLEKNIPKGYHEIVQEYINQNVVTAVVSIVVLISVIALTVFIIKKYCNLQEETKNNYELLLFGYMIIAALVCGYCFMSFVNALQHVVAPNWYLLQRLFHK